MKLLKFILGYKQAYDNNLSIENVIGKGPKLKNCLQEMYKNSKYQYFEFLGLDKYKRVLGIIYFYKININSQMLLNGGCFSYIYKN